MVLVSPWGDPCRPSVLTSFTDFWADATIGTIVVAVNDQCRHVDGLQIHREGRL